MARKKLKNVNKTLAKRDPSSNTESNIANNTRVLKCSRRNVLKAVGLLKETFKDKSRRKSRMGKCKARDGQRGGVLPYYQSYVAIQVRNALVTHNWEAAALFLRILLKNPMVKLHKFIWRAFFLIVQHMPEDCGTRMERLEGMCSKVLKDSDFLSALSIPEDDKTED